MLWTTVGGVLAGSALLGGLLAASDAATRRWRARRRATRAGPPGAAGWLPRDPQLAAVVLATLGQLHRELAARRWPQPGVAAGFVRGERVLLQLQESPPGPPVPPWRLAEAEPSGRSWVVDAGQLAAEVREAPASAEPGISAGAAGSGQFGGDTGGGAPREMPYPLLTAVGRCGGWTVLLDLARSPGPISLAGNRHQAIRVLRSLAFELAGSPWSAGVRLVAVGLAGQLAVPDPHRIEPVESGSEAAALAAGAVGPLVLLLARPPDGGPEAGQLARFSAEPRPVAVICLGRSRFAGWTLEIRPDGRFRLPSGGPMLDSLAAEIAALPPALPLLPGVPDAPGAPATPGALGGPGAPDGDLVGAGVPGASAPPARPAAAGARVDWPRFRELVGHGDAGTERARLRSALSLIQTGSGPGARSGPATRQPAPWQDPVGVATVLRCVRRVAELAARDGDPAEAEWALRQGLRLLPQVEGLWRALLQFQAEHHPAALAPTADELVRTIAECRPGRRLERPTRQLLAELRRRPAAVPGGAGW